MNGGTPNRTGVSFILGRRTLLASAALLALVTTGGILLRQRSSASAPAAAAAVGAAAARSWKPASARLMTRFASSVSPTSVRPEYPRPQFARKDWLSLNGIWEFAFDEEDTGKAEGWNRGKEFAERILVPFSFESALSGIGYGDQVHEHVWYRRSFEVPAAWKGKRTLLHFGAVDWETEVFVNGKSVGEHRGGYTPFTLDVTDALTGSGPQDLVVRVFDPSEKNPVGWQPRGKQKGSDGIWYTRTTGIWQTVWLEPVPETHLDGVNLASTLRPDGAGVLTLSVTLPAQANGMAVEVGLSQSEGGQAVATQRAMVAGGKVAMTLTVPHAQAWSPETPHLYDIHLKLLSGATPVDTVSSYTAFRSVGISHGRLTLNGKPYFYRGVLDQGYWPDGIYTPPSDEAIRADVEATKKLGFNMARKHIKLEDPRWYYWCDKLGVAVWQDMPAVTELTAADARENFTREWREVMATATNYPCVVHWIPFNENWGNPGAFQDEIVRLTRKIDPSRPITDASGWTQRSLTDVIDSHNYSDDLIKEGVATPKATAKVVGEFGGVGMTVQGHIWSDGRVYIHAADRTQMLEILRRRTSQLFEAPGVSGFVYTQLTDVEQELNGLLTYDREPKADFAAMAKIMRGEDRWSGAHARSIADWLILGPISTGMVVNDTTETPQAMDTMGRLLDQTYLPDESGLQPEEGEEVTVSGADGTHALRWKHVSGSGLDFQTALTGGPFSNSVVYAVAYVDSPRAVQNATLYLGSDDGAVVWLNGKRIHRKVAIRGVQSYNDTISGLSLRKGRNVLAVKVGQGGGGWGLNANLDIH